MALVDSRATERKEKRSPLWLRFIRDFSSDSLRERGAPSFLESLTDQAGKSLRSGRSRSRPLRIRFGASRSVRPLLSWWQKHELL